MQLGAFSILFNDLSLDETLDIYNKLGLTRIELGSAAYSTSNHINVEELYQNPAKCKELKQKIQDKGLEISALGTAGNPIHPDKAIADLHHDGFEKSVLVAEMLGVPVINALSGVPGGGPDDKVPNWITAPWPEDFSQALEYQWNDVLIPYWTKASQFAADHGVKIGIEAHPNFCVYNVETLLKLRKAVGPNLGCNFDPSHLMWPGANPCTAIRALGDAIFHCHAKDVLVNDRIVEENGLIDPKPYSDFKTRAWNFRTCGYGHSEKVWRDIISALAEIGFDGTISIEHEDCLMNRMEGITKAANMLNSILIQEPVKVMWWDMRAEG